MGTAGNHEEWTPRGIKKSRNCKRHVCLKSCPTSRLCPAPSTWDVRAVGTKNVLRKSKLPCTFSSTTVVLCMSVRECPLYLCRHSQPSHGVIPETMNFGECSPPEMWEARAGLGEPDTRPRPTRCICPGCYADS